MVSKLRLALLALVVIQHGVVFGMTYKSVLITEKSFSQIEAISLVSALLLALATPGVIVEWLIGKSLRKVRQFCLRVQQGNYQERLVLPNESRDGEGEDEIVVLMRDMNWMARQIEIRENHLQQAVDDLSESRRQIAEQNQYLVSTNAELMVMQKQLKERTAELENACLKMQVMAMTDPLTDIANRRCFFDTLEREFATQLCNCPPMSLLNIDIDWFKTINDTYGHEAGDKVLQELAGIIRANSRNGDLAARIGGEEYALLLSNADSQRAITVARRIQSAVAEHSFILDENRRVSVTVSIGVCTLEKYPCYSKRKIYSYADQALYHSKRCGRNRISIFDPGTRLISQVGLS